MTVPHEEEVRLLSMANLLEPLSEEELDEFASRYPDTRLEEGEHLFGPDDFG